MGGGKDPAATKEEELELSLEEELLEVSSAIYQWSVKNVLKRTESHYGTVSFNRLSYAIRFYFLCWKGRKCFKEHYSKNCIACVYCMLSETRQLFWRNFVVMMYNLIRQCNSGWKMTPFTASWSPISPVFTVRFPLPLERGFREKMKSQWCSLHSLPNSPIYADVGMSWLGHRALTHLC